MILICYDGSADSQAAIAGAGEIFGGEPATVLCVWEPFIEVLTRTGFGVAMYAPDTTDLAEIDAGNERAARERAEEGATRAGHAGLKAESQTRARDGTIADAILDEAEAIDARAIVIGTRGLTGLRHMFLGSVSHGVLQEADRPVIVVPSAEAAAARAARRR
jgi:nucleotide-binding universal stress UspA family protein